MNDIDSIMQQAIVDNIFPGGILLVSKSGDILHHASYGLSDIYTGRQVTDKTIFDLASLTKPLATTLALMILVQQAKIELDQTIGSIIPSFQKTDKSNIQIRNLLCHNSGLPDYRPYYLSLAGFKHSKRKDALHRFLIDEPLISSIGEKTLYSDIGFMVLEWVIEKVTLKRLDQFVSEFVYKPLGIRDLFFVDHEKEIPVRDFAATEDCPWRKKIISGVVHDDNAYIIGGISAHAGLFGTAYSIYQVLKELIFCFSATGPDCLFEQKVVSKFFSRQKDSKQALGFDAPSLTNSSCGDFFPKDSTVGHLGFTGTSFWVDLKHSIIIILLTNRIHPSRKNERIKKFRPVLHNLVMSKIMTGINVI